MYVCYQNTGLNTLLKRISVRACLGHNMAVQTFVDSFLVGSADAVNTTYARSGYGFAPLCCIVWANGRSEATDTVGSAHFYGSIGFASSTTRRGAVLSQSQDAAASSDASVAHPGTYVSGTISGTTIDGQLDISSFDSGGITFIVDDQFPRDTRIFVMAFGGVSITNAEVGSFTIPDVTGNFTVNNVDNFQPDMVFLLNNASVTAATRLRWGFGYAISTTKRGRVCVDIANAAATSNTKKNSAATECNAYYNTAGNIVARQDFVSFNSSPGGMTLNVIEAPSTDGSGIYLMIKGGDWNGGTLQTRNDTNDIAVTGLASQPSGLVFFGHNRSLSLISDTPEDDAMFSFGAASSTSNRAAMAYTDQDNLADTEVATAVEYDEVYIRLA